jgi:hypothetical protein
MSALMNHAHHAAGNVGNQLQRTAGHVGNQLQTTGNRLLPPQQRKKMTKDAHALANRNPKLAVCYSATQCCNTTDLSIGLPRCSSHPHRHSPPPLRRLRHHYPSHLLLDLSPPRRHHGIRLHLLRRRHRAALPHTYPLLGQLRSHVLLPLGPRTLRCSTTPQQG